MVRARAAARSGATLSLIGRSRRALAHIPVAARVCALVAFTNAACWSLIMPPFQVTDEPAHFAYVQQLAETGTLPSSSSEAYSPEEIFALYGLRQTQVQLRPEGRPIRTRAGEGMLQHALAQPLSRRGIGGTGFSASEPPLYYALETIPYGLGASGSILDRLELMRLMSALMGGLTALFAFLFLREALPTVRWAWTVGGLGVAFAPLLAESSGGVTPDAMLCAVSAALFYSLALAFRRGLSQRSAIAIGGLIAVGLLTKLNFIGLAPGACLGLIVLSIREARVSGRRAYSRMLAPGLAIAIGPAVLYALVNALSGNPTLGIVSGMGGILGGHSLSRELSYIWQLYLPRLPWMHNDVGELFTTRQLWFRDLVGLYGWDDTVFPGWVYDVALIPAGLVAALCVRALASGRAQLRRRCGELATYAVMCAGLLVLVGATGYIQSPYTLVEYAQPRYLLPVIVLWGVVLALAARGAGRRWGPVVGALLVVLVIGHDLFSQMQVIARYYG
jgi:4-amino-4-deoxy-L-arabinose transferase-like glycosyltransferase